MHKLSEEVLANEWCARKVEILISLFTAKHNLALSLSDDLLDFIKRLDINEKIQDKITCGTTKCTAIICNITGKFGSNNLVSILQKQQFSLLIDESTDIATCKNSALVARYQKKDYTIRDQFFALIEVNYSFTI